MTLSKYITIYKDLIKKLWLPALWIWVVPFVVSFGFYNQAGELIANFWIFKITMIIVSAATTAITLRSYFKNNKVNILYTSAFIIKVQILLDLLVLVLALRMDILFWVQTVLPVYIIFIPLYIVIIKRYVWVKS